MGARDNNPEILSRINELGESLSQLCHDHDALVVMNAAVVLVVDAALTAGWDFNDAFQTLVTAWKERTTNNA